MNALMKTLPMVIAAATLVACNAEQDGGGNKAQNMNGQAVDGRIANGLVFVDRNGNGKWDPAIEASARTDSQGFFSFNPGDPEATPAVPAVDYCSLPNSDPLTRHCLEYSTNSSSAQIIITGGVDISTGERLKAAMALGTSLTDARATSATEMKRISPISTLLNAVTSASDREAILEAIAGSGANENDVLRTDFSTASDANQRRMLANAVIIVSLQNLVNDVKGEGSDDRTPAQRQQDVAKAIAQSIASGDNLLDNPTALNTFMTNQLTGTGVDSAQITRAQASANAVRTALKKIEDAPDSTNMAARIRTAEVVFQLARRSAVSNDADATTRIGEIDDTVLNTITTEIGNLGSGQDLDVQGFTDTIKSQNLGTADFAAARQSAALSALPDEAEWNDTWRVFEVDRSTIEEGDGDDINLDDSYFAFYLGGDENGGPIRACFNVVYKEGVEADNDFDLNKQFVSGNWDKISDARLAIELTWSKFTRDGQMVYLGNQARNTAPQTGNFDVFQLSHDGDDAEGSIKETVLLDTTLTSRLNDQDTVPLNNEGCEAIHNVLFPAAT
ncbi:hypothetical protein ACFOSD_07855 [Salinispirillum marinum]|uniref:Uncharacterized protein n=2 Tax=Saccharospirillaceae TaxID=255527 RepID=A0ABV8BH02_9GAMM